MTQPRRPEGVIRLSVSAVADRTGAQNTPEGTMSSARDHQVGPALTGITRAASTASSTQLETVLGRLPYTNPPSSDATHQIAISKGTLTGVVRTLQSRGLLLYKPHPTDGRRVLLSLSPEGESLMQELFPAFNAEEAFVAAALSADECRSAADALRRIVIQVDTFGEERRVDLLAGSPPAPRRSGRRPRTPAASGDQG
jgi:DNA-binding MarR family transcriptional regulator